MGWAHDPHLVNTNTNTEENLTMTKKGTKTKKAPRAKAAAKKQTTIPGTERVVENAEVHAAAEQYANLLYGRMGLQKQEAEAKSNLAEVFTKHGVLRYVVEDEEGVQREITIGTKTTVKCSKVKTDGDDE